MQRLPVEPDRILTTDAACKLHVLDHDGHAFCVDGTQVDVLEKSDQVCLGGMLQRQDRVRFHTVALRPKIVLNDLANESLEWHFQQEEVCAFLKSTNLPKGDSSRPKPVGFLHTGADRSFSRGLCWESPSGSFFRACVFCWWPLFSCHAKP